MADILDQITERGRGKRFYSFANADGKRWIMPARHMRTAMQLYQPSGVKGKLLKRLFPLLHGLPCVRHVLRADTVQLLLSPLCRKWLANIFPNCSVEFAIFGGTPCVHQKITMQLSSGNRLLGYCKLTDNTKIAALFEREAALLAELAARGMQAAELPRALFCGEMMPGVFAFVQSTVKSTHSRVPHEWTCLHDAYLSRLHACTRQWLPFAETDFARALEALEAHLSWVPDLPGKAALPRALASVRAQYAGAEVEFSACHADFTPWNMLVEGDALFVFDWEYAQRSCPPGLDRYHWYTQTAIFERGLGAAEVLAELPTLRWVQRELYLAYLLEVLSRFTLREQGKVEGDVARLFAIWLELIEKLSS